MRVGNRQTITRFPVDRDAAPSSRKVYILESLAKYSFFATLVLLPMRWRMVVLSRPDPPVYGDYTDFLLFAPDLAMIGALALWGLTFLVQPRRIRFGKVHVRAPLLGLTLAGWVSLANSWDPPLSFYHAVRLSLLFLFFLLVVNEVGSPAWVVAAVGLQVLSQSIVAIGQYLLQRDLGLQWIGEYELDPLWEGVSVLGGGDARFLRAYGLSDHPNILGGCLAFGLLILLAAFLHQRERAWMILAVFVPGFAALLVTFSRSGWLAFFAGCVVVVGAEAIKRNDRALKRAITLAVICAVFAAPLVHRNAPFFFGRFDVGPSASAQTSRDRGSILERAYLSDASNRLFAGNALTGVGLGVSPVALKEAYPVFPINYQPPHFTLLASALETGILGGAFYFLLSALPALVFIVGRSRFLRDPQVIACAALLLAVTVVGFFDYYTWLLVPGRLWQWTAWGFWSASLTRHE
ncbi:O-antigen ligase family protein [Chloroflexi bacterium CFX6]|nr:O-antigen ligase family protein [Chloroflexi bacterium CFX6]